MPPTKQKPRAAIYARVSTGGQDAQMQVEELKIIVDQRGFEIVGEYVDTITGSKEGPERARLMADAHQGKFAHVFVWRFDRFARSAKDLLFALDSLMSLGVAFTSVKETFDTSTAVGRATVTILSAVAELEKNIIKERITAGLDRAKRNGKKLGRPRRDVDVARARQMIKEGRSQRAIAMALRVPRPTLRRALSRKT